MAGADNLAAGTTSYSSTVATSGTAELVAFPDRFGYMTVTNLGDVPLFVRADGTDASDTSPAEGSYIVPAGTSRIIANGAPLWYQSSNVIVQGDDNVDFQSRAGKGSAMGTNPGTKISLIATFTGTAPSVAPPYVIEAAG